MWARERALWKEGVRRIAGVDEVGRGPLAGPVVAAAVILPGPQDAGYLSACRRLKGLRDSKQLSHEARVRFVAEIEKVAIAWAIAHVDVDEIDRINILRAAQQAMRLALAELPADYVLVDGHLRLPGHEGPQEALVKGDDRSMSIAAASVLAKVHRDALMDDLHRQYPNYGFDRNKGYPTPEHLAALDAHGLCRQHRRSFAPVSRLLTPSVVGQASLPAVAGTEAHPTD